jgi:hypothetical protein
MIAIKMDSGQAGYSVYVNGRYVANYRHRSSAVRASKKLLDKHTDACKEPA